MPTAMFFWSLAVASCALRAGACARDDGLVAFEPALHAQDPASSTERAPPRAEDLERLLADYAAARTSYDAPGRAARSTPSSPADGPTADSAAKSAGKSAGNAARSDPLQEFMPKLRDLARRANGTPLPSLATDAWIALADVAGAGAVRDVPGSAGFCDEALGMLRTQSLDDPRLVAYVDRLGRDAATKLGFERGLGFLDRLHASARSAELKSASTLALARSWLDNADGLPEPRFEEAKTMLRELAVLPGPDRADTRWARGARGTLFALEHLRIQSVLPTLHGVDSRGRPFALDEFRGRVLVIDFFRADDAECRATLALRKAWVERFRDGPFALLTIEGGTDLSGAAAEVDAGEAAVAVDTGAPTAEDRALLLLHGRPDADTLAALPESTRAAFARIAVNDAASARARCEALGITWRVAVDGASDGPWARRFDVHRRPSTWIVDASGRIRYRDLPVDEIDVALAALVSEARVAATK